MDMACIADGVEQLPEEGINLPGIMANRQMLQLVNAGFPSLDKPIHRSFADAVDSVIRMNLDEEPVLPNSTNGKGFDRGNFHSNGSP